MNLAQRIVVLVALGVVLHVSCQAILVDDTVSGGWMNYAPSSGAVLHSPLDGGRFSTIVEALIFAAHVGAWLVAALWLLRDRD